MPAAQSILVVGAGAVGQVYGLHLHRAGHQVTFLVKPQHAPDLAQGLHLHRYTLASRLRSVHWRDYQVMTGVDDVRTRHWDQVWLAMSSTALRTPAVQQLLQSVGTATVVGLQPDAPDADWLRAQLPDPYQQVQGLITFISHQSPLPGHPGQPSGLCYFCPPLAVGLYEGRDPARVRAVLAGLRAGGLSARAVDSIDVAGHGADGVLLPWVAALELHGWRLAGLARSEAFALGRAASRQALQALHAARHTRIQPHRWLNQPWLARLLMATAPAVMPLPLEDYLRFHFSKVGAQTRQMLDSYIQMGVQTGQPVDQLQQLLQRLQALDQPPGSFRVCSLRSGCRSAP